MNNLIILVLLILFSIKGIAQNWGPFGAKNIYNAFSRNVGHTSKMHIHEDTLYIGGHFKTESGDTIKGLAKYFKGKWNPVADIRNPSIGYLGVQYFLSLNDTLVIGGSFKSVNGDTNKKHLLYKTGQQWKSFSLPPNNDVTALGTYKGKLYTSGVFTTIGNIQSSLAYWDGQKWIDINNGFLKQGEDIYTLEEHWGELYASGLFKGFSDYTFGCCIAKWNGVKWSKVADGIIYDSYTRHFIEHDNKLWFKTEGSNWTSNYLNYWDKDTLHRAGNQIDTYWENLVLYKNSLYTLNRQGELLKWFGNKWTPISNKLNGDGFVIYDMIVYQNQLLICGDFHDLGNDFGYIARYQDTTTSTNNYEKIKSEVKLIQQPVRSAIILDNTSLNSYPAQLFSINGNILKSFQIQPGKNEFPVYEIKSGQYYLLIEEYAQKILIIN